MFLLIMHAVKMGIIGGLGAVVYVALIGIIYNFIFLGRAGLVLQEFAYSPASRWGIGIILVPILGGLAVVWLIKHYGANERGVREPDILHFVHPEEGKNRYAIELAKSLASTITIGTGGSAGWEIPITQLGATLSYLLGGIKNLPAQQRLVLTAAGSAAGVAAIFNAPLTGVVFALEILLFAFTLSHVVLIGISAVTGILVWKLFHGDKTLFHFKILPPDNMLLYAKQLLLYIPLGILVGLAAVLLMSGISWFKTLFEKNIKNLYLRHTIGLGLVGIMLYLLMKFFGHYYIVAMGYAAIQDIIDSMLRNIGLILLIFFCKLLALYLTLGSGATGGLFSPSLFLGATLGGAFGLVLQYCFPSMQINIIYFVVGGMGGMLASVTGALITSIVFILEISKNYYVALPIIITTIVGTWIRIYFYPKGIYTFKLYQHGLMFERHKL
ncbi:chloride channel protein [Candidatus Berkiella aquae]|uniref:Chloride channel protein n=1 Tax=Candidatus Berkiella aquae TaxID=295108 RepID=A0AAE3HVC8_9GAMM|nr:chloride channel protein [Candidatus Berkiella aquae]MCS5711292.1 chloride channel protein [Candidatus Berkiella aquae]